MSPSNKQDFSSIYNIAHRGARSLAPENTMMSIEKAWHIGAHGVEVDVAATLDGELILFHDDLLTRTTDVSQKFTERKEQPFTTFTLQELQSLDAGSWFVESDPLGEIAKGNVSASELLSMKGIRIPTLADVLQFIKDTDWYINLELKELPPPQKDFPMVEKLLHVLEQVQLAPQNMAISSFVFKHLKQIQKLRPDIEVNALIGFPNSGIQDWGNYEFSVYNANSAYTDEEQIEKALAKGCRVNLFTVNDPIEMKRFLDAGVEKLITDYPQILRDLK